MLLAIFIFVCFAASTTVNSIQSNYSGARNGVEKPISNAGLPPKNTSLARQLRQDKEQPDWCKDLKDQSTEEVLTNCKKICSRDYILRIGKDVTEEAWKKFIGNAISIDTNIEIADSTLSELHIAVEHLGYKTVFIKNNPKLRDIDIKGKDGSKLGMSAMEIKSNPALKSIKIEAEKSVWGKVAIIDNGELETAELNVLADLTRELTNLDGHLNRWSISNNPKLRSVQLQKSRKLAINGPFHIVGNKALIELKFPESVKDFDVTDMLINENDNLESIRLPETTSLFFVKNLEIRQNDKLKTIDVGDQTRWKDSHLIVRQNPLLSSETLKTLKSIVKKNPYDKNDIQDVGERDLPTTSSKGEAGRRDEGNDDRWRNGEEAITIAIFPSLLILGYLP